MTPEFSIDTEAQQCIDDHLDLIDAVLRDGGMTRSDRQSVLDDVRGHIVEMLRERVQCESMVGDVQAVIAELDPPESYAGDPAEAATTAAPEPRLSRLAVVGAFWALFFFAAALPMVFGVERVEIRPGQAAPGPAWWQHLLRLTLLPLGLSAPFGTTILGLISIQKIRHSGGKLCGLGLAVADTLFFPLVLAGGAISCVFALCINELFDIGNEALTDPVIQGIALAIWCVLTFLIARWAWRAASAPAEVNSD